jgi:hypothetical protein
MRDHVKILGILHIVFGAIGIVIGFIILLVFGGLAGVVGSGIDIGDTDRATGMAVLGIIGAAAFIFTLVLSLPSLIAGIGLLKYRPWARILTIVLSAIDLLHIPLGTLLGIYGLWVLLSPQTEALFRSPAQPWPAAGPPYNA